MCFLEEEYNKKASRKEKLFCLVRMKGVEPPRLAALDPKLDLYLLEQSQIN